MLPRGRYSHIVGYPYLTISLRYSRVQPPPPPKFPSFSFPSFSARSVRDPRVFFFELGPGIVVEGKEKRIVCRINPLEHTFNSSNTERGSDETFPSWHGARPLLLYGIGESLSNVRVC